MEKLETILTQSFSSFWIEIETFTELIRRAGALSRALTSVAQGTECQPLNGQVNSSRLMPGLQGVCKRQLTDVYLAYGCFSPSLFPSLPLLINTYNLKKKKKKEKAG